VKVVPRHVQVAEVSADVVAEIRAILLVEVAGGTLVNPQAIVEPLAQQRFEF